MILKPGQVNGEAGIRIAGRAVSLGTLLIALAGQINSPVELAAAGSTPEYSEAVDARQAEDRPLNRTLLLTHVAGGVWSQSTWQWDANANEPGLGGAGVWNAAGAHWDRIGEGADDGTDTPVPHDFVTGDIAVFSGAAGTVSIALNPPADIVVKTGGYRFAVGGNSGRTYHGSVTIAAGGETFFSSGNNSARVFNGRIDLNGGTLHFQGGNRYTIVNGSITGEGSVSYDSGGGLVLNDNSYSGSTFLSGGVTDVRHANAFGTSTVTFQGGGIDSTVTGVTLADNAMMWDGDIAFTGTQSLDLGTGKVTLGKSITVATAAATLTVGGAIEDDGSSFGLTKVGAGTLALKGPGGYTGPTRILGGTLQLSGPKALYNGDTARWTVQNIAVAKGGALGLEIGGEGEFSTDEMNLLLDSLMGANGTGAFAPDSAIAFDTSDARGGSFTIAAAIADPESTDGGSLGVVKMGAGTLVLKGACSHTGATRVGAGTLLIEGALGKTTVAVEGGAAIGGTGTIRGDLLLDAEARLEVVDLQAPLTVNGTVSIGDGFGIANLAGIDWDALDIGTPYRLIAGSRHIDRGGIANLGAGNAAGVGQTGRFAYFDAETFAVVVTDGPANAPIAMPDAELIGPFDIPGLPRKVYYRGEPAVSGVIDLIPEKAFFGRVFAFKNRDVPGNSPPRLLLAKSKTVMNEEVEERLKARDELNAKTRKTFAERGMKPSEIDRLLDPGEPSLPLARWHIYCEEPGDITMTFFMQVTAEQAEVPWLVEMAQGNQVETVSMDRQKRVAGDLRLVASDASKPQPQTLTFRVETPGRVTFYFDQGKMPDAAGDIAFIRLRGSAVKSASLLRAPRRASAFYFTFTPPEGCKDPRMCILETKPVRNSDAFTPMKTPFGYTGYAFSGQFVKPGGLHWSMWGSAIRNDEINMAWAPRIIAQDSPTFATQVSANEGTTVRGGWAIFKEPVLTIIQAMRYRRETDGAVTCFGYIFDQAIDEWRLYNAAQYLSKSKDMQPGIIPINDIRSFIETPGAYGRRMDGDVRHVFARRAWFQDKHGIFYPAPHREPSPTGEKPEKITLQDLRNNAAWPAEDYATEGWVHMHTGGMAFFSRYDQDGSLPDLSKSKLPAYLESEKSRALYHLPVTFGEIKISGIGATEATVEFEIQSCGPNPKATIFYGKTDGVTFLSDPAAVKRFEALRKKLDDDPDHINKGGQFHNVRTVYNALAIQAHGWRNHADTISVHEGRNRSTIKGLEPGTKYCFRIQVTHDQGMSWTYTAESFTTLGR